MKTRKFGKFMAILLCLVLLTGQHGITSFGAAGGSENDGSTNEQAAEKTSAKQKEDLTPTPEPTEEALSPTPEATGSDGESLSPTPEATGSDEENSSSTPEADGSDGENSSSAPEADGETEGNPSSSPEPTNTNGSKDPEKQPEDNTQSPDGQTQENKSQENNPQPNGPQTEDSETGKTNADGQPEAEQGEEPADDENEIAPIAETVSVKSLNYREKGAPFLNAGNNVVYFSLDTASGKATDYIYEFAGSPIDSSAIHLSTASDRTGWFTLQKLFNEGGTYTLTVKSKDNSVLCSAPITIYQVTFDPAPGKFDSQESTYTGYGMADSAWSYYNIPSTPKCDIEGSEYIGWSTKQKANSYNDLIYTAGAAGGGNNITVYAAYGIKRIYDIGIQNAEDYQISSSGEMTVNITDSNPEPITLTLKNTGNQHLFLSSRIGTSDYDVVLQSRPDGLAPGETLSLTLTPRALGKGTYQGFVWIYGSDTSGGSVRKTLTLTITTTVSSVNSVKVLPESLTKSYGETKNSDDVKVTVSPGNINFNDLGVTLRSSGFAATANVGTYEYAISGSSDKYEVTLDPKAKDNKVTVIPATPEGAGTVNATGVHEGGTLADSLLSGTFTNPFTHASVTGELTWTEDTKTVLTENGSHSWKFTPTGQDEKNYESVTGTVEVTVSPQTPVTLSVTSQTEFVYDGASHQLTFSAVSEDGTAVPNPITVQYQVNNEWTAEPPVLPGTYAVKASVDAAGIFAAAEYHSSLTITRRVISLGNYYVIGKPYDGTTDADPKNINISIYNKVSREDVGVTATAAYDSKDAGSRNVAITLGDLIGRDADHYQLPDKRIYHTTALITPVTIHLESANLTKEYGAVKTLTSSDFTVTGLVGGETAPLEFSCSGAESEAAAGSYPVSATLRKGGNYTFDTGKTGTQTIQAGTLTVTKVKPVPSMSGIHAGQGKYGGELKDVTLNGLFVNPHNAALDVPGTLTWSNPETRLPDTGTYEAEWTFTPSDTQNYNSPVTGKVTVTLEELQPFNVTVHSKVSTYNGQPQEIVPEMTDADKEKADVVVEYRLRKDIALMAVLADTDAHDDYVTQPPTDAGFYDVHVHVYVKEAFRNEYADNLEQATLDIAPATPTVEEQTVTAAQNTILMDSLNGLVSMPADINGNALEGQLIWDAEGTPVTAEGDYSWTFLPDDPNYSQVRGSTHITLAEDNRIISAKVYNLPNDLNYSDYAVVDIVSSGLKAGDTVTFYEKADCQNSESASVTVTEDTGTLRVALDGDALADSDGVIFARITSSTTHQANEIQYGPELGFTVPDSVATLKDESTELPVTLADPSYEPASISITVNEGDVVTVENGTTQTALIKGIRAGSTVIQVMVTFQHPDQDSAPGQTITITKTVRAFVEEATGSLIITKTVVLNGETEDPDKAFTFTIRLTNSDGSPLEGETAYGDVTFTDGSASIELRDGQTRTIAGIPGGMNYTVTENTYEDYITTQKGDSGTIAPGNPSTAAFTNTKKASVKPNPTPDTTPGASVSPEPGPGTEPGPDVSPEPGPSTEPQPSVSPEISTSPEPSPSTEPEPSVSPEISASPEPDPDILSKVTQTDGIGDMEIPADLKDQGLDTPEAITDKMKERVIADGYTDTEENIAFYNVEMQISTDGGISWTPATSENFPAGGLTLTIPYPTGTDGSYIFTVTHMFTHTMNGYSAGDVEVCSTTNVTEGIQFTVHGLSPIAVAWTEAEPSETPEPTVTPDATVTPEPSETPEATPSITPEVTPSTAPEVTPGATPTVTPEQTPTVTPVPPSATPTIIPTSIPQATPSTTPASQQAGTPKTADSTQVGLWIALLFLAGCEIFLMVFERRRNR